MANNNSEFAKILVEALGGKNNIVALENCMTRLRIKVTNISNVNEEKIKQLEGVLGVVISGNNIQIIVGPGKSFKVSQEMTLITGLSVNSVDEGVLLKEEATEKNKTPIKQSLKKISEIFIPIIPAFIACGLLVAIFESTYVAIPGFQDTSLGKIMGTVAYSVFTLLPIIVGYNTSKVYGGTPIIGAVLAAVLTSSGIAGAVIFGVTIVPGLGGVISVIVVAGLATIVEKAIRKFMPDFLDMFLTPLFTIVIMTVVGLVVFQPLGGFVSTTIGNFVSYIIYNVPILAGFATLVYLPLVVTGMHHGLIAVNTQLISDFGVTFLLPVTAMAGAGQVGASFAVYLKTKNKRLKKTIRNALPVGMLGIGEPLLWGCTIPLGRPFIASCIGGAIAGSAIALMKVAALVPELGGLPLGFITNNIPLYFVGILIAYVSGFVICNLLGWDDPVE